MIIIANSTYFNFERSSHKVDTVVHDDLMLTSENPTRLLFNKL
jgi:hypothetical protein